MPFHDDCDYVDMDGHVRSQPGELTPDEIIRLRSLLSAIANNSNNNNNTQANTTTPTNTIMSASTVKDLEGDAAATAMSHGISTEKEQNNDDDVMATLAAISTDSDYPHFANSSHAWAVFAGKISESLTRRQWWFQSDRR